MAASASTDRLFVALDLPAPARAALAAFRDRVDPRLWRPVSDEALHVTLVFLGHRPLGVADRGRRGGARERGSGG